MLPMVDPAHLARVQQTSQHIRAVIAVNYGDGRVELSMSSDVEEARALIPQLCGQFATALATQLSSFFAIKGEIVETSG